MTAEGGEALLALAQRTLGQAGVRDVTNVGDHDRAALALEVVHGDIERSRRPVRTREHARELEGAARPHLAPIVPDSSRVMVPSRSQSFAPMRLSGARAGERGHGFVGVGDGPVFLIMATGREE